MSHNSKRGHRLMALAVVCALSLSLLTGCQQTQTTEETGSTTGDGTTTAATTAPTKPEPLGDYTQRIPGPYGGNGRPPL